VAHHRAATKYRPEAFFAEHGISPQLGARHLRRWEGKDKEPIRSAYQDESKDRRDWWARIAERTDGWVMNAYAPPGLGLTPILAQLRPDDPVATEGITAWDWELHPTKRLHPNARPVIPECITREGVPVWSSRLDGRTSRARAYKRAKMSGHVDRKAKDAPRHLAELNGPFAPIVHGGHDDGHSGSNCEYVHAHQDVAKYMLNRDGKRVNMYPEAVSRFGAADVVYLILEGKLKHLACLTYIIEHDLRAACVDVASVTLWNCPELVAVALRYLVGKTVVIVADADGHDNPNVMQQSFLLERQLASLGISAVVALPPDDRDARGELLCKGLDDYLAAGGRLEDLVVYGRQMSNRAVVNAALREADIAEADMGRLAEAVELLAYFAFERKKKVFHLDGPPTERIIPEGRLKMGLDALEAIAQAIGSDRWRIIADAELLKEHGIIKINKPLTTEPNQYAGGKPRREWRKRPTGLPEKWKGKSPTFRVPEALQAQTLAGSRLAVWLQEHEGHKELSVTKQERTQIANKLTELAEIVRGQDESTAFDFELASAIDAWNKERDAA
jgi:hypothetical protein